MSNLVKRQTLRQTVPIVVRVCCECGSCVTNANKAVHSLLGGIYNVNRLTVASVSLFNPINSGHLLTITI